MSIDRRRFLALSLAGTAGLTRGGVSLADAPAEASGSEEHAACLVDTTLCIGCRKCEEACNRENGLPRPEVPFSDRNVLRHERRPTDTALSVVNEYPGRPSPDRTDRTATYVKVQCLHCLDPACVSACIVGAMRKSEQGPVLYDHDICIGCRYCMIACPFEIPAFEYSDPTTPGVRKCQFCADTARGPGANPACAAACPVEAIVFGRRGELLDLARKRIDQRPVRYLPHIYGEHEVGGTSWLYLVGREIAEIGFVDLPDAAPPRRTEAIQHGIFKYGAFPLAVYGALGGLMWYTHRRETRRTPGGADESASGPERGGER